MSEDESSGQEAQGVNEESDPKLQEIMNVIAYRLVRFSQTNTSGTVQITLSFSHGEVPENGFTIATNEKKI